MVGQAQESAATGVTGTMLKILVLPAMDQAYTFQLTYLPEWADLTTALATNTWQIPDDVGGCDWVLWDCVERIKLRNKEFEEAQVAAAKRETEEGKVVSQHLRLTRTGPVQRRSVAARSPSDVWRRWL